MNNIVGWTTTDSGKQALLRKVSGGAYCVLNKDSNKDDEKKNGQDIAKFIKDYNLPKYEKYGDTYRRAY